MAHYVMLSSLSESGRKVLRQRPGWIRKVNRELERKGAKVRAQYAVLGPYDFVTVLEAPDNETVSSISIEMGARGSVSMRATVDRPGLDSQGRSPLIKIRRVRKGDLSKVRDVLEQAFGDFFERQMGTRPRQVFGGAQYVHHRWLMPCAK